MTGEIEWEDPPAIARDGLASERLRERVDGMLERLNRNPGRSAVVDRYEKESLARSRLRIAKRLYPDLGFVVRKRAGHHVLYVSKPE